MSRGTGIVLGVGLVWAGLWGMGSWLFFRGADAAAGAAERLAQPITGPREGGEVRLDAVVSGNPEVTAPYSRKACAAAQTQLARVTSYRDTNGKVQRQSAHVATRRTPAAVTLVSAKERLSLPLQFWKPPASKSGDVSAALDDIPAALGVSDDELARATSGARGDFVQYTVDEWLLLDGQRLFVLGTLDPKRTLLPAPGLDEVMLFRGSQAEAVEDQRQSSFGLRIAGFVFVALAVVPPLVAGVLVLRRKRGRPSTGSG